jgi:putative aldouronate transport system permease protein
MNKIRQAKGDRGFSAIIVIICVVIFMLIAYPLYFVVIASFSDPSAIQRGEMWFWPVGTSLEAYAEVLRDQRIWTGYRNTLFYTALTTIVSLAGTLPAAYALSRKDFPLRKVLMGFFLIAMYFNGGMIPTYLLIRQLHLLNTIWAIVLPTCMSIFHLIIARTFFETTIQPALREAAEMDGCTDIRFFFVIVLPLSKAIIAVIGLYTAVASWNSYMSALMYLTKEEMFPLQIVLRNLLLNNQFDLTNSAEMLRRTERMKYALIVVSTLPIMCVYPFIQKHFAQGAMIGSVKG